MIYVYKILKREMKPVASVELLGARLRVSTTEKFIARILEKVLPRPAYIKHESKDGLTTKRAPVDHEENLRQTLKQHIYKPYFPSEDAPEEFTPTEVRSYPISLLEGAEAA